MIEAYKVSWLARYLKELLESDLKLSNLWVEGEVSNISRSTAGHLYFTLKDEAAQLRCVMFRLPAGRHGQPAGRLGRSYDGAPLENGTQVLAHGRISFYEARGDLQLIVDFLQPAGVGPWQAEFLRLKERLEAEGLFDPARKRPLPPFPRRIGVVTSPAGAVFHDICHVIGRRWPLAEVVLAPTPVQGPEAAPGICAALAQLNAQEGIDVVIVARGGGSLEELWAFNDEAVARAIYASRAPVVSGVGHETDYTIADYVADRRAPTPSAAAEAVAPDWREVSRQLERMELTMLTWTVGQINRERVEMERMWQRLRLALPDLSNLGERVRELAHRGSRAVRRALEQREERLNSFALQLRSLDPRRTLARGYAVVHLREGRQAITSVRQVKARDRLDIHVRDGRFPAEVSRQYGF